MKLSLWTLGVGISVLSPFVKMISQEKTNSALEISWTYLGWYLLIVWGMIGMVYFIEMILKTKEDQK